MFSIFSRFQQRDLAAFLEIPPECSSGPCDKQRILSNEASLPEQQGEIAYRYRYNSETGEVEYSFPDSTNKKSGLS